MRQKKPKILLALVLLSLGLQGFSVSKVVLPLPEAALHEDVADDHSHEGHSHDVVEENNSHDFSAHRHSHNPTDHSHDMTGILMFPTFMVGVAVPQSVTLHATTWLAHIVAGPERPPKA